MNNIKLINIKDVIEENEKLRIENERLRRQVCENKSWTSIREGIIIPKALEMGAARLQASNLSTMIAQIVKSFLDIHKITEINESNYERAKNITLSIVQVLGNYEWKQAIRLKSYYAKNSMKI